MKYSCYQGYSVIRSWFAYLFGSYEERSTKVKFEHEGFYCRVREKFLTSLTRFQSYIQGKPEQLLQFLSCFSFVVKLGVSFFKSISCHGRRHFNGFALQNLKFFKLQMERESFYQ